MKWYMVTVRWPYDHVEVIGIFQNKARALGIEEMQRQKYKKSAYGPLVITSEVELDKEMSGLVL